MADMTALAARFAEMILPAARRDGSAIVAAQVTSVDGGGMATVDLGHGQSTVVAMGSGAAVGDSVRVLLDGRGGASILSNETDPPSNDNARNVAADLAAARATLEEVAEIAAEAAAAAAVTDAHVWADGGGTHVADVSQDEWGEAAEAGFPDLTDDNPYLNILVNYLGVLLRSGLDDLVSVTRGAVAFYDGAGNGPENIVASFGRDGVTFDEKRPWHLGNDDAYIAFVPASGDVPAKMIIGGPLVEFGSGKTLSELLAELDGTLQFKVDEAYSQDASSATLTAHVYKGGEDVAAQYPGSAFAWYRKAEHGAPLAPLGNGRTLTVARSTVGYGAAIVCRFTPPNDSGLLTAGDDQLADSGGAPMTGRTPSGDYVRVADLTVEATVFDTDCVMVVGPEDEHLVSIETLKDVFASAFVGTIRQSTIRPTSANTTGYGGGMGYFLATDSSSESLAATPKAVKAAYDLASGASETAGQALSAATGAYAFKVTYSVSGSSVICAAHVYSAGAEVTTEHAESCFVWSFTLDGGTSWTALGTGRTKQVSAITAFGGNVKCDFTPQE